MPLDDSPPASVTVDQARAEWNRFAAMFRSLRHRDFFLFWGGNFLSNIGTWMQNVALGWLILVTTDSPFLLGLNGFLASAPSLVFSLPGGALADRANRRNLMIVTQTSMMLLALTLAVLTTFRLVTIGEILAISFLTGLASSLNNPSYQALVPDLVERDDLVNAVALNSVQFNMSRAIGPTLAGLAMGSLGAAGCFYLNTVSFLALIIALLAIDVSHYPAQEGPSVWGAMLDGLRYVRRHRVILALLTVPTVLSILGLPFVVLMPVFARDILNVGASGLGFLMGGAGLGAVIAALTFAALGERARKGKWIFSLAAVFSLALILLSQARTFVWAFCLLVVLGATMVGALVLTNSALQALCPPELRGRVMSMYNLTVLGFAPLGSLQMGAEAEAWGARAALALGGTVCLVYFSALLAFLPRLRQIVRAPAPSRAVQE